jgi:hypothetical protein
VATPIAKLYLAVPERERERRKENDISLHSPVHFEAERAFAADLSEP